MTAKKNSNRYERKMARQKMYKNLKKDPRSGYKMRSK